MKVAFVFMHPFSESMGSVVRVRELALSLGRFGVDVYIFTPYERSFDLFPHVHVVSASNLINTLGLSKAVYSLSKFLYYNKAFPGLFSKTEDSHNYVMAKLIKGLAKLLVKRGIDIVQVEQDVALPFGIGLKKQTGLPLIVDLHNISSEELVAAGVLERSSDRFFALQKITQRLLSETDHVVVVSEAMQDYVACNYGLSSACVSVVPPGGRPFIDQAIVKKRGKPAKVVYAGLVAYRERVDLFVRSMPFVRRQHGDVQFYITNKGEAVGKIKRLANDLGVKPEFFWYDDYNIVNHFLSSCHVGILPSSNDVARRMGTPAKLFNYLSAGLPVVANDVGGWTEIIKRERVGIVTSNTPEGFAEGLITIIKEPSLMKEYAINSLELIKSKYNWDNSASMLFDSYEELS